MPASLDNQNVEEKKEEIKENLTVKEKIESKSLSLSNDIFNESNISKILNFSIIILAIIALGLLFMNLNQNKSTINVPISNNQTSFNFYNISELTKMILARAKYNQTIVEYLEDLNNVKVGTKFTRQIVSGIAQVSINGTNYIVDYYSFKDAIRDLKIIYLFDADDSTKLNLSFTQIPAISYICINSEQREYCTKVINGSYLTYTKNYLEKEKELANSYRLNFDNLNRTVNVLERLAGKGLFSKYSVYEKELNGTKVKCANYSIDYSLANLTTRLELGIDSEFLQYKWDILQCQDQNDFPVLIEWVIFKNNEIIQKAKSNINKFSINETNIMPKIIYSNSELDDRLFTYNDIIGSVNSCYQKDSLKEVDQCLLNVARDKEFVKLCSLISNESIKALCLSVSFTYQKDISVCSELKSDQLRDDCYATAAYKSDNRACQYIGNVSLKNTCYNLTREPRIECYSDRDCGIFDGKYCLPKHNLANYSDLKLNSTIPGEPKQCYVYAECYCDISNKCSWRLTNEFRDCATQAEGVPITINRSNS
ncbi:MAG: hypothetical protein QXF76_02035 [Candidatus Anstonellales archaeon]